MRFSRDRRGYEHTFLVHESSGRGRPSRARVLYWFRTPPGIKVGREVFDDEARRKIESQNPGIAFDWPAIAATPMPPIPEVEHWRERRRAERAAKVARREEQMEADADPTSVDGPPALQAVLPSPLAEAAAIGVVDGADGAAAPLEGSDPLPEAAGNLAQEADTQTRKRRRRRGGRRRRGAGDPLPASSPEETVDETGGHPAEAQTDVDLRQAVSPPQTGDSSPPTPSPSESRFEASEE